MEKILYKKDLGKFFQELSQEYNFFAPVKQQGNIVFNKVKNSDEIILDFMNSKIPPKSVLFPQMETLFEYQLDNKKVQIKQQQNLEGKNIIFGIRPCDAYSFKLMENFFEFGDFQDNLFLEKRKNSILFGLGCNHPLETCFCTSVNGHPFKDDDVDVFMVDLNNKYLMSPVSDNGKEIIENINWLENATKQDLKKVSEISHKAEDFIKETLDLEEIAEVLFNNFESPIWKKISETCLGCGSCAFLCPTCHCFDVIDEEDHYNNRGRRVRIWDTCQSALYTKHTSGHNPRPTRIERCRNRILHKFCYYPKNYDLLGCVGCGRCIQYCPVNNDIRSIIKEFKQSEEKEEIVLA